MVGALHIVWQLGPAMAAGVGVVFIGVWAGWNLGRYRRMALVRLVGWWVDRVVKPMIGRAGWPRRAATIFLNNSAICALVVASGAWAATGWAAVAMLGVTLGMGLRVLGEESWEFSFEASASGRKRTTLGFALNMLEPPAIVLAVGLSLGRRALPAGMNGDEVWSAFAIGVLPALLVAAMGEALWLGALRRGDAI